MNIHEKIPEYIHMKITLKWNYSVYIIVSQWTKFILLFDKSRLETFSRFFKLRSMLVSSFSMVPIWPQLDHYEEQYCPC